MADNWLGFAFPAGVVALRNSMESVLGGFGSGYIIGASALFFAGLFLLVRELLPLSWHPDSRREVAFSVINYVHAVLGTIAGAIVLSDDQLWSNVLTTSNVMLNATCCVTLGYLIIDSTPLGNLQALSKDPDAKEYHMFHMLIAVGFALYVVNGTGGLVAAIGLLSELDTVIINQRQFLSFVCRKRCDSRATWQLLLLVGDSMHAVVTTCVRVLPFLFLVFGCWRDVANAVSTGELDLPAAAMVSILPFAPRMVIVVAQVATLHAAAAYNAMLGVEMVRLLFKRWTLYWCPMKRKISRPSMRAPHDRSVAAAHDQGTNKHIPQHTKPVPKPKTRRRNQPTRQGRGHKS